MPPGDDAAGRAGNDHVDRRVRRGFQGHLSAVGADDHGAGGDAGVGHTAAHGGELAGHDRPQVSVGDRGEARSYSFHLGSTS